MPKKKPSQPELIRAEQTKYRPLSTTNYLLVYPPGSPSY
jgi:hypothetical protein